MGEVLICLVGAFFQAWWDHRSLLICGMTSSSPWQICTHAVRSLSYSDASHSTSCLSVKKTHFQRACSTQEGCLPFSLHPSPSGPPEAVCELSVSRLEDSAADSALFANTEFFYLGEVGGDLTLASGLSHILQSRFPRAMTLIHYFSASNDDTLDSHFASDSSLHRWEPHREK